MLRATLLALAFTFATMGSLAGANAERMSGDDFAVLKGAIHRICLRDGTQKDLVSDSPESWESQQQLPDALLEWEYASQLKARSSEKTLWPLESLCKNVSVVSGERIRAFFAKDRRIPAGWEGFEDEFGANGYVTASRPAYSADRNRALVVVGAYCGLMCGNGQVIELIRTNDGWRILRAIHTWIS